MADENTNLTQQEIVIRVDKGEIKGTLTVAKKPRGIIIFAHGSGSSRLSPRNQCVAGVLQKKGCATLLFDLLTDEEEVIDTQTQRFRFDIGLLTRRLTAATEWCRENKDTRRLSIGYFGASTGAAAALCAAAEFGPGIKAVVSRGGRPDLAMDKLDRVVSPTLLIVGGNDFSVIEMNREAAEHLNVEKEILIVPGAGHLFEEPGALEQVARAAGDWFVKHL
jgi:pimeloyl-ACP methyl ester carboxylesterase